MANKKITSEEVFDPNLFATVIKAAAALKKVLEENLTTLKDISKTQAFNSGDDIKKYNDVVSQTTTNVKAFEMAQKDADEATEQFNKEVENSIENQKKVKKIIDDVNGSLDQNIKLQTKNKLAIKDLREGQKDLNKQYSIGAISQSKFLEKTSVLSKQVQELTAANSKLGFTIKAQIKEGQAATTSFDAQAQKLGQLRSAYRKLTEEERVNVEVGGRLLKSITALDKQVKKNDESIGNFQRSVGNYKGAIKEAARESGFFTTITNKLAQAQKTYAAAQAATTVAVGASTGALRIFKIALISTGIGAIVVALGSLVAFFLKTQKGAEIVSKAFAGLGAIVDVLIDRFSLVGEAIADLFSGDFTGATDKFAKATEGVTEEIVKETKAALKLKEALIEVEKVENDLLLKRAATRAEVKELNKIAEDTTKSFKERSDAAREAINIEQKLLDEQLNAQKKRAANLLGELDLTDERLEEIRKNGLKLSEIGLANSTEDERKAAIEEVAKIFTLQEQSLELQTTLNNKLNIIETQRANNRIKEIKDVNDAKIKADEEFKKVKEELDNTDDEDFFSLEFDEESKAMAKADQDRAKAKKKADEEAKKAAEKAAQDQIDADLKAADEQRKIAEQLAKDKEALRKEQIGQVENVLGQVGEAQDKAADQEQEKLERKAERTTQNIDVQAQLAAQGLDNTLAESQKKQAEIELEQQELAEKQEKRQKRQVFYESVLAALKEGGNPIEAVGKALAAQAAVNLIAGSFYEGTDRVGDDAKANLKGNGKDNTLVALTQEERVIGHKDSLRVRNKLGNISNKDLVDLALNNQGGVSVASMNDRNIVSGLEKVTTAVEGIQFHLNIDPNGNISKEEHRRGLRKVLRAAKRRPRLNG